MKRGSRSSRKALICSPGETEVGKILDFARSLSERMKLLLHLYKLFLFLWCENNE